MKDRGRKNRYGRIVSGISFVAIAMFILSCSKNESPPPFQTTPYEIEIPFGFPTNLNIPADNPMTVEGIKLGRYLFYDGRLSGRTHLDSMMCCGTCHLQANAFECGINHPEYTGGFTHGLTGKPTPHVMLPMVNLVWNQTGYLWNGSVHNIEDLVWMGVIAEHEMAGDTNRTKAMIQQIPGYPEMFRKAFGSETVTMKNIGRAIAQFVRTFISANSKFDRFLRGEVDLTASERSGFILFTTEEGADCFHCHGGYGNPLFTTHLFYNNGKDSSFTGPYEDPRDRYHVTGDPMDYGAYKATTLRNIEVTGPYMHDGRYATLDEVIDFYSHHLVASPYIDPLMHHIVNGGVQLTPAEKADLKAFIRTLRDDEFLTNPAFGPPVILLNEKQ